MRREKGLWKLIGLVVLFFPLILLAEGRFRQFNFQLPGVITDVIIEDLNDDSLRELLVIQVDKKSDPPRRSLSIFFQTKEDGFAAGRRLDWTFPAEVASIDVADVASERGQELVFITEGGVSYATVSPGEVCGLKELIPVQSVVALAYDQGVPYYNFARDYNGDGRDDVLVVGFTEAVLALQGDGYSWFEQKMRLRPMMDIQAWDIGRLLGDSEHPMYRVAYYVPQVYSLDNNSDGQLDLVVNFRQKVVVFNQHSRGFSDLPDETYKIEVMPEGAGGIGRRRGPVHPLNLSFADLDGDGRVDVVANQSKGNLGNMQSRAVLFWGRDGSLKRGQPSLEFKCDHTIMAVFIRDVNKDRLPDLILPAMDMGVWTAGKVLVTGGFDVIWNVFLQQPDHSYHVVPDRKFATTLKFNITRFELEGGIPNVFADFNGDGYPDQAVGIEEQVLLIQLRDANGQLMGVEERLNLPVSIFNRALDINADNLADLVIHYDEASPSPSALHILLNKGNWTAPPPSPPAPQPPPP